MTNHSLSFGQIHWDLRFRCPEKSAPLHGHPFRKAPRPRPASASGLSSQGLAPNPDVNINIPAPSAQASTQPIAVAPAPPLRPPNHLDHAVVASTNLPTVPTPINTSALSHYLYGYNEQAASFLLEIFTRVSVTL